MNRRGFLGRLMGGIAAATLAAHLVLGELVPVPAEPVKEPEIFNRLDVLYGWNTLYADCAVRIMS